MINKKSRRAAVLAVWGNSGSGKTTFSVLFSKFLADRKKQVLLISADLTTPILSVLFPRASLSQKDSIGEIFDAQKIDNGIVSGHVIFPKSCKNTGVLSYAPGDNPYTYTNYNYAKAAEVIETASEMADVLILDCASRVNEVFTAAAVEYADVSACILTPDLYGISYFRSNAVLLHDARFHQCKDLFIAGKSQPFQNVKGMQPVTGKIDGSFPYSKSIHVDASQGKLFTATIGKEHRQVFETVFQNLKKD